MKFPIGADVIDTIHPKNLLNDIYLACNIHLKGWNRKQKALFIFILDADFQIS